MVLEEHIMLDGKGVGYARYLSTGMESGAHAAATDFEQSLETQQTEKGPLLRWIYQMFLMMIGIIISV
jgi:hypothetical protein